MLDPQKKMETHEALRYGCSKLERLGRNLVGCRLSQRICLKVTQTPWLCKSAMGFNQVCSCKEYWTSLQYLQNQKKNLMHTRPHRLPIPTISSALFWQLPHPAQQPAASIGPLELGSWSKIMRSKTHKVLPDLGDSNSWISTHRTSRQIPDQTDWRGHGAWGWSLNPDQVTIISGYQIISSQASFLAIFGA